MYIGFIFSGNANITFLAATSSHENGSILDVDNARAVQAKDVPVSTTEVMAEMKETDNIYMAWSKAAERASVPADKRV